MPLNKDKLLRYQILNDCFRNTARQYNIDTLVECCKKATLEVYGKSVSKRTIQLDIQQLQEAPYNVEFDEDLLKRHYYRYADTSYSLAVVSNLSKRERTALHDTIEMLRPICADPDTATPLMQWMFMSLQRLESGKPLAENSTCVSFENNDALAGMGNFNVLLEYIMNRQPVVLRYKSFKRIVPHDIRVHPYFLKQYNGRWFLLATPDGYENISVYALDRILTVSIWKAQYKPTKVDFNELFSDMMGVTISPNAKKEHIVLKVAASRYPYIETKPFSENQKVIKRDDEYCTIAFPMKINKELVAELLSFGSDLEVIEPISLREEIAHQIADLNKKYSPAQEDCTKK